MSNHQQLRSVLRDPAFHPAFRDVLTSRDEHASHPCPMCHEPMSRDKDTSSWALDQASYRCETCGSFCRVKTGPYSWRWLARWL